MLSNSSISIKQSWKNAWRSSPHKVLLISGTVVLFAVLFILPEFFNKIEQRNGAELNDLLLDKIAAHNVSNYIFTVIWGMAALAMIRTLYSPVIFTRFVWVYSLICIFRIITITLIPLNPPIGLVNLKDPLTGIFYGEHNITKDLFFSGHTATLFLIYLVLEKRRDRNIALAATCLVGILLLIQHVHYTIDILAAPFIVYGLYKICQKWLFHTIHTV